MKKDLSIDSSTNFQFHFLCFYDIENKCRKRERNFSKEFWWYLDLSLQQLWVPYEKRISFTRFFQVKEKVIGYNNFNIFLLKFLSHRGYYYRCPLWWCEGHFSTFHFNQSCRGGKNAFGWRCMHHWTAKIGWSSAGGWRYLWSKLY